jgi:predicted ATP-grasp superfamily ATP-dependent carboligase
VTLFASKTGLFDLDMNSTPPGGEHPLAVVLGADANAYGLVRSLSLGGVRTALANVRRGPAYYSRLPQQRWQLPDPLRAEECAKTLAARLSAWNGPAFIIPTNEPWVHMLDQSRGLLGPGVHLPLARSGVVALILSKSAMSAWCRKNQIPQPLTRVFHPGQDWPAFLSWARKRLPIILKPETKGIGDGGLGFFTADFHTKAGLDKWARSQNPEGPSCTILAQGLISGPGVKLTCWHGYRSLSGAVHMVGITKLRSRPPRLGGCTTAACFHTDEHTQKAALSILEKLDYTGFFDLEFITAPGGGPALFIEINPRPGNPNYAATVMGLNLPLVGLKDHLGSGQAKPRIITNQPGCWLDLSVDPWLVLAGANQNGRGWTLRSWLDSITDRPRVDAYFCKHDPGVFLYACLRLAALGVKGIMGKKPGYEPEISSGEPSPLSNSWQRLKYNTGMLRDYSRSLGYRRMAAASLVTRVKRKLILYYFDLREPLPELEPLPGLHSRKVQPKDLGLLLAINPALNVGKVKRLLADGGDGRIFFLDQTPVLYLWLARGAVPLEYLRATLHLDENMIIHQSTFTRREYRRRGVFSQSRIQTMRLEREQGLRYSLSGIAWWNSASMRAIEDKCRMQPLGAATCWGAGPFTKLTTSGKLAVKPGGGLFPDLN